MTPKAKIKVIKKSELTSATNAAKPVAIEKKPTQAAREMVSTVSNWVTEFKERRREETKQAFEKLFAANPQTNGV